LDAVSFQAYSLLHDYFVQSDYLFSLPKMAVNNFGQHRIRSVKFARSELELIDNSRLMR